MESLEAFLQAEIEPLTYIAFFGALLLFGVLERLAARSRAPANRGKRWATNFGLTALNVAVLSLLPVGGFAVAVFARDRGYGVLNLVEIGPVAALAIGILVRSLMSWAVHLAMHKIGPFWRVHRIHHTDRFVDVSTTVRFHPVEFLISTPIMLAAIVLTGIPPVALLVYELIDAFMAVFTHSNLRIPRVIDRALRWVVVTPDMHRIHHSSFQPETDSNYGVAFSFWDRMFGTYREKDAGELATMTLGLDECQNEQSAAFGWLLLLPFRSLRPAEGARPDSNFEPESQSPAP